MRDENHVLSQDTRAPELSQLSGSIFLLEVVAGDEYIAAGGTSMEG